MQRQERVHPGLVEVACVMSMALMLAGCAGGGADAFGGAGSIAASPPSGGTGASPPPSTPPTSGSGGGSGGSAGSGSGSGSGPGNGSGSGSNVPPVTGGGGQNGSGNTVTGGVLYFVEGLPAGSSVQLLLDGSYVTTTTARDVLPYTVQVMAPGANGATPAAAMFPIGSTYGVKVTLQPSGMVCTPTPATGTIDFITRVNVSCLASGGAGLAHASFVAGVYADPVGEGQPLPGVARAPDGAGGWWLFGGRREAQGSSAVLVDELRHCDARDCVLLAGSGLGNAAGHYGRRGVASPESAPGSRVDASLWVAVNGDVWLFGGRGVDSQGTFGVLSDLWRFDPGKRGWTGEGGSGRVTPESD